MKMMRLATHLVFAWLLITLNLAHASSAYTLLPVYSQMAKHCPNAGVKCEIAFLKKTTRPLCVNNIIEVDLHYWQSSRQQQVLPVFQPAKQTLNALPVNQILFMQESASLPFQNNKNDIIDLALALKSGKVKVANIPPIEIWQDQQGRIWTTNHRRVITMILAGITQMPVKWADRATVLQNKKEFTTTNGGKKITVWITDKVAMVVTNDGKCAHLVSQ